MSRFKRNFTKIEELKNDNLFGNHLKEDIKKGVVFPAVRDDYMCFYYKGSRPFVYDGEFSTHKKYMSLLDINYDYISRKDLLNPDIHNKFTTCYKAILQNCSKYAGLEAEGVSNLYSEYSYVNSDNDIVVLDIEIAFENESKKIEKETTHRIDLLLYNKLNRTLRFVEAKHFLNGEIWAKEGKKPKVIKQINKYNKTIEKNKQTIINEYSKYITIVNKLFGLNILVPNSIIVDCGLFIFGYDGYQKDKIKKLLIDDGSLEGINHYERGSTKSSKTPNVINTLWKKLLT
ncbi:MAG: hypothetical protein ACOC1K_04400 [Nanoarchaeota archaeon]